MTTPPLDLPALKEIASAVEMFDDEWAALGTGPAGGDHWYIRNDGESIASVSCQDGINEAEREPIARHIAAFDPPTVLRLLDRVEKAERACQTLGRVIDRQCEDALTATDSQDLMWGDDGDGDWAAVWERVLGLGEKAREATDRAESAERDLAAVTVSRDGWQTRAETAEKAVARVESYRDRLEIQDEQARFYAKGIQKALDGGA